MNDLPLDDSLEGTHGPVFNPMVATNGYRWWYFDAISDDMQHAFTVIVFIGSVFSPYYKWARSRGPTPPQNHCAVNIALYGRAGKRWAMTERGAHALACSAQSIRVGPSSVHWTGERLVIDLDEVTVPVPSRIRGRIYLYPECWNDRQFSLDARGMHHWQPVFPRARAEVRLARPDLNWTGDAYFDTNHGGVPLEDDFHGWNWSRSSTPEGGSTIFYDRELVAEDRRSLGIHIDRLGAVTAAELNAATRLPATAVWRIARTTRSSLQAGSPGSVKTLEDTPFYARSLLTQQRQGQALNVVHESLSMTRFKRAWVRMLLPFKMPRRPGKPPGIFSREA